MSLPSIKSKKSILQNQYISFESAEKVLIYRTQFREFYLIQNFLLIFGVTTFQSNFGFLKFLIFLVAFLILYISHN